MESCSAWEVEGQAQAQRINQASQIQTVQILSSKYLYYILSLRLSKWAKLSAQVKTAQIFYITPPMAMCTNRRSCLILQDFWKLDAAKRLRSYTFCFVLFPPFTLSFVCCWGGFYLFLLICFGLLCGFLWWWWWWFSLLLLLFFVVWGGLFACFVFVFFVLCFFWLRFFGGFGMFEHVCFSAQQ